MKLQNQIKIRKYPAKLPSQVFRDKSKYIRKSKFKKDPRNGDLFLLTPWVGYIV